MRVSIRVDPAAMRPSVQPGRNGGGANWNVDCRHDVGRRSRSAASLHEEFGLTNRELQVVRLLADGCSNATIALKLGISAHTARRHTERVFQKFGVQSRAEVSAHILL